MFYLVNCDNGEAHESSEGEKLLFKTIGQAEKYARKCTDQTIEIVCPKDGVMETLVRTTEAQVTVKGKTIFPRTVTYKPVKV